MATKTTKGKAKKTTVKGTSVVLDKQEQEIIKRFRKMRELVRKENEEPVEDSYDVMNELQDFISDARYTD